MKNFTFTYNVCGQTIKVSSFSLYDAYQKAKAEAFARKLNAMPEDIKLVGLKGGI